MKTVIKSAPSYYIENGKIFNKVTNKEVTVSNGSVRLIVNGTRKSFKFDSLIKNSEGLIPKTEKEKTATTATPSKKIVFKKKTEAVSTEKKADKAPAEVKKAKVKAPADANKPTPAELIKQGLYPYKIKDLDKIEEKIKSLSVGDEVTFIDYITKKKTTATIKAHSKFGDNYPAARVAIVEGKNKTTKLLSYLNITKK